jgi:endonuclease/exonuclease/phosphatase family metal-dependent hydrolase
MSTVKIATFNIEWMTSIFNADWKQWDGTIKESFPGKYLGDIKLDPIEDVPGLCQRIANTITEVNPDIIGIQEGPPLKEQMELFVDKYLGGQYKVFVSNSRWQAIHTLVREPIAGKVSTRDPYSEDVKSLWHGIPFQPWGTVAKEDREHQDCYRRPLMLQYEPEDGRILEILVLHTKSKYSELKTQQQWEDREPAAVLDALLQRQKLSAEILRLREYVENRLVAPHEEDCLVVMGDLNDGPLAEDLEKEFLIHNIIDEVVGSIVRPKVVLRHAMNENQIAVSASTEFRNPMKGDQLTQELIDHIFVSPGIWEGNGNFSMTADSCIVEDGAYNANSDPNLGQEKRHLRPSDHRPVSFELTF